MVQDADLIQGPTSPANLKRRHTFMKNLLMLAAAGALTLGIAACSSDPVSTDPNSTVNKYVEFKKGDTFTYEYYDRMPDNTPDPATKQIRVWVVEETGLTYRSQPNASRITESFFQADGVTPTGTPSDTVYLVAKQDGSVYQYDVIGSIIRHIPAASTFIDQLSSTSTWAQISDVKTPSAFSWLSSANSFKEVNISILTFTIDADMMLGMSAQHLGQGKRAVIVPAGTLTTESFNTDHSVTVKATDHGNSSTVLLNDSMAVHYDVSIKSGIVRQTLDSKTITLNFQGVPIPQPIAGFEMNLKSAVRAK